MGTSDLDLVVKLVIAAFFGIIIGFDRQVNNKPAGTRTQMLICVGSALLAGISIQLAKNFTLPHATSMPDPARLMAQIVTGIGFLGAGVILKENNRISGVTTAATIWLTAAIGISVGAGFYIPAIVSIILVLLLHPLGRLQYKLGLKGIEYTLQITNTEWQKTIQILNNHRARYAISSATQEITRLTIYSSQSKKNRLVNDLHKERVRFEIFGDEE